MSKNILATSGQAYFLNFECGDYEVGQMPLIIFLSITKY